MELNEFCEDMIQIEENSRVFYENLAEICDERIKEIVLMFAGQEERHKEIMVKLFRNIKSVRLDLSDETKKIIKEQTDFINNNKGVNFGKEKEFFNFAFAIEQKSIDAYNKVVQIFEKNTKEYRLFSKLAEEEKKHMIYILKRIYELQ